MNILIIGDKSSQNEAKEKLGDGHKYQLSHSHSEAESLISQNEIIFDFIIESARHQIKIYSQCPPVIFLNTAKITLATLIGNLREEHDSAIFGFNGLPTFFDRSLIEVSLFKDDQREKLNQLSNQLQTEFQIVEDRVGLVTPRVICMIINEAYYTTMEGIASREDIDKAMKLGTNYPFGPFEWCQRIGINHVYELLAAVYEGTLDERYRICPLLESDYLKGNR